MALQMGPPLVEAISWRRVGVGVGAAFYGFAESAVGPVHILKFCDGALLVGKNGANCWMFYIDRGLVLGRSTVKLQKYTCFWMRRERFAWRDYPIGRFHRMHGGGVSCG
jgi:hypothetical protein